MNNYAYFIASYNKPDFIPTLEALKKCNATYPIFIVVGEDDPKLIEYKKLYPDNLLIFNKDKYRSQIDCIGSYIKSDKICTYSRLAVYNFAKILGIRYVGYLFDDIKKFRLRYNDDGKIRGIDNVPIDKIVDLYIKLLNASKNIYIVGPPQSSFYIGVNSEKAESYTTRYGNFFIYDTEKELEPYKASILEDMSIVLYNNMMGKLSICPFGLQVECRDPAITKDSYANGTMSLLEYYQHYSIIDSGCSVNIKSPTIHYKDYIPKIVSEHIQIKKKARLF